MPWKETSPMRERIEFILDHEQGVYSFSALCEKYGISRKTGYKILNRFGSEGFEGLADRSRAPKTSSQRLPEDIVELFLQTRRKHPRWGPRKILDYQHRREELSHWPARSTLAELFKRHGLVKPRRRRPHPGHPGRPLSVMSEPNGVWTVDFKGHFRTGQGPYCYPLTIVDGFSRYLLACKGLPSTSHEGAQRTFLRVFREFGLPRIIRSDNGTPFATQAIRRLSRLHVWWIRLGIVPELIEPASPQQNGRHERMHRTLKDETARPPRASAAAQQRAFDHFRTEYNEERPHEALDGATPAMVYEPSPRAYPTVVPQIEYPDHFEVRRVSRNGGIRWKCHRSTGPGQPWVNVSHVLAEEYVGLEEVDDGIWSVYFGSVLLGRFDERTNRLEGSLRSIIRRTRRL